MELRWMSVSFRAILPIPALNSLDLDVRNLGRSRGPLKETRDRRSTGEPEAHYIHAFVLRQPLPYPPAYFASFPKESQGHRPMIAPCSDLSPPSFLFPWAGPTLSFGCLRRLRTIPSYRKHQCAQMMRLCRQGVWPHCPALGRHTVRP